MVDPRFYATAAPLSLGRIAEIAGARLAAGADPDRTFRDVAGLEEAGPDEVSFLDGRRLAAAFAASRAGACLVHPAMAAKAPKGMALLLTEAPYRAYALTAAAFHPEPALPPGVDPRAAVDPTARLGERVRVEAGAVVGALAELGAGVRVGANAVVGPGVIVGEGSRIGPGATLAHCILGRGVTIYPGARIGQDGFGFAMGQGGHVKVPQLGRVLVGDGTEIGANTCIDRGTIGDTVIGPGCMIDNLVQIGHNVRLGRGCVLVSQVGISGSTRLDDFVVVGGQGGLAGHLHVGAGARIAARAGVTKNIPAGETVGGFPAVPVARWRRQVAALSRLARRGAEREGE